MKLTHEVPPGFDTIARHFMLSPEHLAYLLCVNLVQQSPKRLVVIEHEPDQGRRARRAKLLSQRPKKAVQDQA